MALRMFARRSVWWPTAFGWLTLGAFFLLPAFGWWLWGERFLSATQREAPDVLVVEGWIGLAGVAKAKIEFESGHYSKIVTVGSATNNRWGRKQWNYAELAHDELVRLGLSPENIVVAAVPTLENQRTFASAIYAQRALSRAGIHPKSVNVFTLGVHARRSRLVFQKVFSSQVPVGCISWWPAAYGPESWWQSSERATDMIKESTGFFFELLLNSARISNRDKSISLPAEPR